MQQIVHPSVRRQVTSSSPVLSISLPLLTPLHILVSVLCAPYTVDMRSPVVTFSIFAAAAFTATRASTLGGNAGSLALKKDSSDANGGPTFDAARTVGLGISNGGIQDHLGKRSYGSRGYVTPEVSRYPRPDRPVRPAAPQEASNYGGTCNGASADGSNSDGSSSLTPGGDLSGGVSCSGNAVGASVGSSDPSYDAPPEEFAAPETVVGLAATNVTDVFSDSGRSAATLPPPGNAAIESTASTSPDPAKRLVHRSNAVSNAIDDRVPAPATPSSASNAATQMPEEDITDYADAVGAGGLPAADDAVFENAASNQDGAAGQSIQGVGIPGMSNGQYPGGEAHPGTPGSADGGTVTNSGNVVNNDVESNTPGVGRLSKTGIAKGGVADL